MSERFVSVDGVKIHVSISGEGKPLLLVHGLGGPLMWQRVTEPLSRYYKVLVIDLPGFGDSERGSRSYSYEEHGGVVVTALRRLGIERAHVAGISYGGQVAAAFAARYPEAVERLVLLCSTGFMPAPLIVSNPLLRHSVSYIAKYFLLRDMKRICQRGERSFYNLALRPSDLCQKFFEQLSKPGHRDGWLNGVVNSFSGGEKFKQLVGQIAAPTLILWGENDKTVSPEHAKEFHRLIRCSRVLTLQECAHSIPLEKPEEVCQEIRSFLDA